MPNDMIQRKLTTAFAAGLRQELGEPVGSLLRAVAEYFPHTYLDNERLKQIADADKGVVVQAILANQLTESTMRQIQRNTITSALLADKDGVSRWATEGLNRCRQCPSPWPETAAGWQWILDNSSQYMTYCREVKCFQNQM
jgi:hypothetical protein